MAAAMMIGSGSQANCQAATMSTAITLGTAILIVSRLDNPEGGCWQLQVGTACQGDVGSPTLIHNGNEGIRCHKPPAISLLIRIQCESSRDMCSIAKVRPTAGRTVIKRSMRYDSLLLQRPLTRAPMAPQCKYSVIVSPCRAFV